MSENIEDYLIESQLGSGGNATVSKATANLGSPNSDTVAIKVLRAKNPNTEPVKRFIQEIRTLIALQHIPGVVPILDYCDYDNNPNEYWYTMPIGAPLSHLDYTSMSTHELLGVFKALSQTLAAIHKEGYSHRDIKPDNIIKIEDQWCLADFGLAYIAGNANLTNGNKKLGPLHYLAPEMLNDPSNSEGAPADVFSFAKTLWVCLTGQTYPHPYQLGMEANGTSVSLFREDTTRISSIDVLLRNMTAASPPQRPKIDDVNDEISAWLDTSDTPMTHEDLDSDGIADRIHSRLLKIRDHQYSNDALTDQAIAFLDSFSDILTIARDSFISIGLGDSEETYYSRPIWMGRKSRIGREPAIWEDVAGVRFEIELPNQFVLYAQAGIYVDVDAKGNSVVSAELAVGQEYNRQPVGMIRTGNWNQSISGALGSTQLEKQSVELKQTMLGSLKATLNSFADSLPE